MLNMKDGCKIENADKLYEAYEKTEYGYLSNINVEKIVQVLKCFISMQKGPVFFFLEVPANLSDEKELSPGVLKSTHTDIYYKDYLEKDEAFNFLDIVGELLANDGLCSFGFGSRNNHDEIAVNKYNVVTILTQENNVYDVLFQNFDILKTEKLITAWDIFTEKSPGYSERIEINGKDVYSLIKEFKDWGLYFAEQREDS